MSRTRPGLREALALWDRSAAPLATRTADLVVDIGAHADERPLPNLPTGEQEDAQPAASAFASKEKDNQGAQAPLVENSQQFFAWFEKVESDLESEHARAFHGHLEQLQNHKQRCSAILDEITGALKHLADLEAYHASVSSNTKSLHSACEQLLQDQTSLAHYAECLSARLNYYNELERIAQKLNSPTLSVLSEQFVPLLTRLDECIAYISEHPHFLDSRPYLARFSQLQSRALNLVKLHVINTLKMATQHIQSQVQGAGEADASFTLFYGKFRLHAPRIKALMGEMERRAPGSPAYTALIQDCCDCYYAQRTALLGPSVTTAVRALMLEHHTDLPALLRAGCAYMSRLCANEHQLFHHFFASLNPGLGLMLETLATTLYEAVRPLYISKIVQLDVLVELCVLLRAEVLEDRSRVGPGGTAETEAFAAVAEQMLQDIQHRLVFLAQGYTASQIRSFEPDPKDLNYPDRLVAAPAPAPAPAAPGDPVALYGSWFPTLPRTLILLSKLARSLNKPVFDGLAQEIVGACLHSLRTAAHWLAIKQGVANGQLFLIKHLILLREQTQPFDIDAHLTEITVDFSPIRELASGLLRKGGFHLDGVVNLLTNSAPHVTEARLDFRKEVDESLRETCQEFIRTVSKTLTSGLQSFLVQVDALPNEMKRVLSTQPFARPDRVRDVVKESSTVMHTQLRMALNNMVLYLANKETERILFRPIKAAVLETHAKMLSLLSAAYTPEERDVIACPSMDEIALSLTLDALPSPSAEATSRVLSPAPSSSSLYGPGVGVGVGVGVGAGVGVLSPSTSAVSMSAATNVSPSASQPATLTTTTTTTPPANQLNAGPAERLHGNDIITPAPVHTPVA